ncbi:hypothetical protein FF80_03360 [Devosia sp. LC5]|nr:hypothetical protein FF80_03360 [Devosia sp. LC5]
MKLTRWALPMLTATILAGCGTTSGNFCDVASAIRPSVQDDMTDGTKRQIVSHNNYGEAACGWRR